jgi:hypothetical protein
MNPMIRLRLTEIDEFAHDHLQRVCLEVDQDEQELLLGSMQESLATPTSSPLAGLAFDGLVRKIQSLIGPGEGCSRAGAMDYAAIEAFSLTVHP